MLNMINDIFGSFLHKNRRFKRAMTIYQPYFRGGLAITIYSNKMFILCAVEIHEVPSNKQHRDNKIK